MKTAIPTNIDTIQKAKIFLSDLIKNDEEYHPEDNAHDIIWSDINPTAKEMDQLNNAMDQIYELKNFDPCLYIIENTTNPLKYKL